MYNVYHELINTLNKDERLVIEGKLAKNKVIELALQLDIDLLRLLRTSDELKKVFFQEIGDVHVFDKVKFQSFISNKQFLPDSFTEYKNKIGLFSDKKYLTDSDEVVLAFPYKDCVLEGGQTKEDVNREEVFWNETLASDQIDKLFERKVLTNFKEFSDKGINPVNDILSDASLIIKGNNLLALYSLRSKYRGEVKLIYIDPPYYFSENKEEDSFRYNTNFKLSSWMVFMKNRLSVARDFLTKEGAIFIQISDDGSAYVKVLLDEIFGRENFLNVISVRMKNIAGASGGGEDKKLKKNIEFIYIYSKDINHFTSFKSIYDYKELTELVKNYKENKISWKYTSVLFDVGEKKYLKSTVDGIGEEIRIYERVNPVFKSLNQIAKEESISEKEAYYKYFNKIYTTAMPQSSIRTKVLDVIRSEINDNSLISIEYVPRSGKNKGSMVEQFYKGGKLRLFSWLKDVSEIIDGKIYKKELQGTYWDGFNLNNLSKEGSVQLENGKKPEALLQRIIEMATNKNDIVMDYHLGSGTTCAVAHKMGRRYIGIEQLDYGENDSTVRLERVIKGDKSGISEGVNWQSGGSFIYMELAKANQLFVDKVIDAKDTKDLLTIWDEMVKKAFLSYKIKPEEIDATKKDFKSLSFEDQQRFLITTLDKNFLYVPYSEIDDISYDISDEDKELNRKFYSSE